MSQPTANMPGKILIVDDDPSVAQGLDAPLAKYNVKVDKATTLDTAFYLFNNGRYDVVLIEIEFAFLPGLAMVQKWRNHETVDRRATAFIMLAGNKSSGNNEALIREMGDLEVIAKPFGVVQILPYLSRGLATRKRLLATQELKDKVLNYYEKTGDFAKAAEQVLKKIQELGPSGLSMLYDLYEKGGKYEEALAIIGPMSDKDPGNISLLNAKGRILMRLKRFDEAKTCLAKADEIAPQNIDRINELATSYLHLKDPDNSVKKFRELITLNPENPDAKFEMFSKLYDHGFDTHAIGLGKETTKPMEIVRHYNNKGVILSKESLADQALLEYQRALRFFPQFKENYRIYYNIALAKIQAKTKASYEEAHQNLLKCLELAPDFEKAKNTLAQLEKALKKSA